MVKYTNKNRLGKAQAKLSLLSVVLLSTFSACSENGDQNEAQANATMENSTQATLNAAALPPSQSKNGLPKESTCKTIDGLENGLPQVSTQKAAIRFLHQATFGPTEHEINTVCNRGYAAYLTSQFGAVPSKFSPVSDHDDAPDRKTYGKNENFCTVAFPNDARKRSGCYSRYFTAIPVVWGLYKDGVSGQDQLRQRVAFALSQIFVISSDDVARTYGIMDFQQMLRNKAFGNFRDILTEVTLSPSMGVYLNNVNNSHLEPNENFARELLQLFTIGTCELNMDGSLVNNKCKPTYTNKDVRNYAYALSGWTYPTRPDATAATGKAWNPRYMRGHMIANEMHHDTNERTLLGEVVVDANTKARPALDKVIDSVFNHQNLPPFIAKQMIQFLVTSNPSPEYVKSVANAFASGKGYGFGSGKRGDMKALIATILLHPEARGSIKETENFGRLRDPVQQQIGMIRQLNGKTDGVPFFYHYSRSSGQQAFNSPSVFNFYSPDFEIANGKLNGNAFEVLTQSTFLARLQFVDNLLANHPLFHKNTEVNTQATGTSIDLSFLDKQQDDAAALIERLEKIAIPSGLSKEERQVMIDAVNAWDMTPEKAKLRSNGAELLKTHREQRKKTAVYLIYSSPAHLIQR